LLRRFRLRLSLRRTAALRNDQERLIGIMKNIPGLPRKYALNAATASLERMGSPNE
jgi:hypothetical protein